jgi:hypothetical protein
LHYTTPVVVLKKVDQQMRKRIKRTHRISSACT